MVQWVCKQLRTAYASDNKKIIFNYQSVDSQSETSVQVLYEELEQIHKMCIDESSTLRTSGVTLLVDFHRFVA